MCVCMYVFVYACVLACTICMYICMFVCQRVKHLKLGMYVCMFISIDLSIYQCIDFYMHRWTSASFARGSSL